MVPGAFFSPMNRGPWHHSRTLDRASLLPPLPPLSLRPSPPHHAQDVFLHGSQPASPSARVHGLLGGPDHQRERPSFSCPLPDVKLTPLSQRFNRDGCPNCENVLQLRGNSEAIQECTSQVFEGLIAIRDPAASWVARWQRLDNYVGGTYAAKVTGSVRSNIPRGEISESVPLTSLFL